jgi:hypothetical protein
MPAPKRDLPNRTGPEILAQAKASWEAFERELAARDHIEALAENQRRTSNQHKDTA